MTLNTFIVWLVVEDEEPAACQVVSLPCYLFPRSMNLSVKPFGLLSTNRANRARWSEGRPASDERHR
jgi:hypothetical protein